MPVDASEALLCWYAVDKRRLPWRAEKGAGPDPYRVWLSEVMLQQTTVAAVRPYFEAFVARWPNVEALAAAEDGALMAAWAGLGYYARARNLLACARIVAAEHKGLFPDDEAALRKLPGIGAYTAAAIAAIAFGRRAAAVDGNVERVVSRLHAVKEPLPAARPKIRALADAMIPDPGAGDFAQAMMDLGATICTPRRPACGLCPLRPDCRGFAEGLAEALPYRAAKGERPVRRGATFVAVRADGAVLLRERPLHGLLGGMLETPSSPWEEAEPDGNSARRYAPVAADWRKLPGLLEHTFTHFHLELSVYRAEVGQDAQPKRAAEPERCLWLKPRALADAALPSVMRKVLLHALEERRVVSPAARASPAPRHARRRSA